MADEIACELCGRDYASDQARSDEWAANGWLWRCPECAVSPTPPSFQPPPPLSDLLRDVAGSAMTFDDPRVGYVEVQIDRATWDRLNAYRRRK